MFLNDSGYEKIEIENVEIYTFGGCYEENNSDANSSGDGSS